MDYEPIDKTEFQILEKEPEGELDYNELENMSEQQPRGSEQSTKLCKD